MTKEDPVIDVPTPDGNKAENVVKRFRRSRHQVALERDNKELRQQLDQLKTLVMQISANAKQANPLPEEIVAVKIPRPVPVKPPTGIEIVLRPINRELDKGGDPYSTFSRVIPVGPDGKRDPRICIWCKKDVSVEADFPLPIDPSEEQRAELRKLHALHMQTAKLMRQADNLRDKRYAADHTELEVVSETPVKDCVAYLNNKAYTAEEHNALEIERYNAKLLAIKLGGIS